VVKFKVKKLKIYNLEWKSILKWHKNKYFRNKLKRLSGKHKQVHSRRNVVSSVSLTTLKVSLTQRYPRPRARAGGVAGGCGSP